MNDERTPLGHHRHPRVRASDRRRHRRFGNESSMRSGATSRIRVGRVTRGTSTTRFGCSERSRSSAGSCCSAVAAALALVARHDRAVAREDHREHGARAQRDARAVGLDERSGNPLHVVGMGPDRPVRSLEARPQLRAPHVHEHRGDGRGRRIRHPAHDPRREVAPDQPAAADRERGPRADVRVGYRAARPDGAADRVGEATR